MELDGKEKVNHRYKFAGLFVLVILLLLVGLTYFYEIYPGGYSIQKENDIEVIIEKKSLLGNETFVIPVSKDTEMKLAVLHYYLADIKSKWYVIILTTASLLLSAMSSHQLKKRAWYYTLAILVVVLVTIQTFFYIDQLETIRGFLK